MVQSNFKSHFSMKNTLIIALCAFFLNTNAQTTLGETRISLNGYWKFITDPLSQGVEKQWFLPQMVDKHWDEMRVPSSFELRNEYAKYSGKTWYRTHFKSPLQISNKKIFLEFEAVSMSYTVFLNGKKIGEELAGNNIERFDITDKLNQKGDNQLTVMVDNTLRWGAYYNWGGIRRPVSLCIVEPLQIIRQEIVATPDLKTGTSVVEIAVFVKNDTKTTQKTNCDASLFFDKKIIKKGDPLSIELPAQAETIVRFKINLTKEETRLWHFDEPNLYTSEINLFLNKQKTFSLQNRFGIRKIEIDNYQLKLNGESVRLAGFNWVADDRTTGNSLPAWRYKEDIDRMKALGANMARLSHRPLPQEVMDYLDEKGFLVIAEFNNWSHFLNGQSIEPKQFATKLVQQNFNHPSIIGWSVGNEMGNQKQHPEVNAYVENIIKFIKKQLDSTRIVTYVSNTADFQKDDAAKFGDMIWINKYDNYLKAVDNLKELFPNKPVFMTEYGGHSNNLIYDTPNRTLFSKLMVDGLSGKENAIGFALWTFNDYRSTYKAPNLATSTPMHENRQWGVVDVYRNKKRSYRQMQKLYAPVRGLQVENDNITIIPREKLDIPAFVLRKYTLVWSVFDRKGKIQQGDFINLPTIKPSDKPLDIPIKWTKNEETAYLKVSLLSPTGYSVLDTIVHQATPPTPKIEALIEAPNAVRIVFEPNEFSKEYIVKYGIEKLDKTTAPTIDHYIDLTNLEGNKTYQIAVFGINSVGESALSEIKTITIKNGYSALPPVIWLTEPCDKGFFVGMSYQYDDVLYQIRYGSPTSPPSTWQQLQVSNFGMCHVPNLQNGQKVAYQIRRLMQFNVNPSEWSEVKEVTPSPFALTGKAKINGFYQKGNEAILSVSTAKNASAYRLSFTQNGVRKERFISQTDFDYLILKDLEAGAIADLEIKALEK